MKEMIGDHSILETAKTLFAKIQENHASDGLTKVEFHGGRMVQLTVWTDDPYIGEMTRRLWATIGAAIDHDGNVELIIQKGKAYVNCEGQKKTFILEAR